MVRSIQYELNKDTHDQQSFNIPFYPDDIKALATVMWANISGFGSASSSLNSHDWGQSGIMPIVGQTCLSKNPKRDSTGHLVDQACRDMNPATFHLIVTHLMGQQKQSFVIDVNYNSPINNHPVNRYQFLYFDPLTGKKGSFESSLRKRNDFNTDISSSLRNQRTTSIVGVKMLLQTTNWKNLSHDHTDSDSNDHFLKKEFIYDLELDENGTIIDGQWRGNSKNLQSLSKNLRGKPQHPDYLFWIPTQVQPYSLFEGLWSLNGGVYPSHSNLDELKIFDSFPFSAWNETTLEYQDWESPDAPLPSSWSTSAAESIEVIGANKIPQPQVMRSIIDRLVKWSQ
jgi:hypothetical protein